MTFQRFKWLNGWVDDPRLSPGAVAVLTVLLRHMDDDGEAYPRASTIARKAGYSRTDTARKKLIEASESGWITWESRPGKASIYRATMPDAKAVQPEPDVELESPKVPPPSREFEPKPEPAPPGKAQEPTPYRHPNTGRPITVEEVLKLPTDQMIMTVATATGLPVSVGAAPAICMEAGRIISDPAECKRYLHWKICDLASAQGEGKRKLTGRAIMRALSRDAQQWLDDKQGRTSHTRGGTRSAITQDTEHINQFAARAAEEAARKTPQELIPDDELMEFDDVEIPF